GPNLREVLDREPAMSVPQVVDLVVQVAAGLDAAHQAGLVHRDVKPANILLEGDVQRRALITDFGIAKDAGSATLTATGAILGTLSYAAPEQLQGTPVDRRADVYARVPCCTSSSLVRCRSAA
nr:serine/threonine-protein kinase [Baekduia sp.]